MRNPYDPSSQRNAMPTRRWGDGTAYPQRPNESSWRRAHRTASSYHHHHQHPSTASSTCATQLCCKRIATWPTQGTISTCQHPCAKPSSRSTHWGSMTWTLPQGCHTSSHPHHRQDARTHISAWCGYRSSWGWDNIKCSKKKRKNCYTRRSTWWPPHRSSITVHRTLCDWWETTW